MPRQKNWIIQGSILRHIFRASFHILKVINVLLCHIFDIQKKKKIMCGVTSGILWILLNCIAFVSCTSNTREFSLLFVNANVNVNVNSRTALIRNRVSRRVNTRQHRVGVPLKLQRETRPLASRLRGATEGMVQCTWPVLKCRAF